VQHFVENAGSLLVIALYGLALAAGLSTTEVIVLQGLAVAVPSVVAARAGHAGAPAHGLR
jgi:hypothetical protein